MRAIPELGRVASKATRQLRMRKLRIGIRQLERAEMYIVAVRSLELDEDEITESVDELIEHVRALRRYLLQLKATA